MVAGRRLPWCLARWRFLLNPKRVMHLGDLPVFDNHIKRCKLPGFVTADYDHTDKQSYPTTMPWVA